MASPRRPVPPLDTAALERLSLRYVERFATSRAKLAGYLARKIRERGWDDSRPPDPEAMAERMAGLGYVDDRIYAESKANSMTRRGLGARRVREALRHAGIEAEDVEPLEEAMADGAAASALAFARKKRIGPFAREAADRAQREKQISQMIRAGHGLELARTIVRMEPGEAVEGLLVSDRDG